jgi:serine/threonine-protein kinase
MGVNEVLDLPVAIKFIHPKLRCPELTRALQREARAIAALQHPAIVRVFDSGELSPDNPYIVLERLEGEDLRELLDRKGRLTAEEAVRLLLPIASGVQAAHARGIVHRDLKPENILLARDDAGRIQPKVLDFGIATLPWEDRSDSECRSVGTIGYMPPEQAFNLEVDPRADVWSFCTVLYEVIAGETPLSVRSFDEMRHSLVHDVIPSLAERAAVDAALSSIVERGLRRNPDERWSSIRELGQALARWLSSRGVQEDVSGRSIAVEWLSEPSPLAPVTSHRGIATASERMTTSPFPLMKETVRAMDRRAALSTLARLDALRPIRGKASRRPYASMH